MPLHACSPSARHCPRSHSISSYFRWKMYLQPLLLGGWIHCCRYSRGSWGCPGPWLLLLAQGCHPCTGDSDPTRDGDGDGEGEDHKQLSEKAFDQL